MTYRQVSLDEFHPQTKIMVPQAIIAYPPEYFKTWNITFEEGCDDFDYFTCATFMLQTDKERDEIPFILNRYRGYPENTTNIELPVEIENLDELSQIIVEILANFGMTEQDLCWHRRDGVDY